MADFELFRGGTWPDFGSFKGRTWPDFGSFRGRTSPGFESFRADLDSYVAHRNARSRQVKLKGPTPEEFRSQSLVAQSLFKPSQFYREPRFLNGKEANQAARLSLYSTGLLPSRRLLMRTLLYQSIYFPKSLSKISGSAPSRS